MHDEERPSAVLYQGAIDSMVSHLRAHPDADPAACADSVADLVLEGTTTRGAVDSP